MHTCYFPIGLLCFLVFKLMILVFAVGGKEVGEIQSKLLCKSVLDLYFGEDPFDKRAKEDIQSGLASILQERSD